jgi:hypothetical protein
MKIQIENINIQDPISKHVIRKGIYNIATMVNYFENKILLNTGKTITQNTLHIKFILHFIYIKSACWTKYWLLFPKSKEYWKLSMVQRCLGNRFQNKIPMRILIYFLVMPHFISKCFRCLSMFLIFLLNNSIQWCYQF